LETLLGLADVVEIIREPRAVARADVAREVGELLAYRIEDAAARLHALETLLGRAGPAEEPLEQSARVDLHRQRLGIGRPRQRVRVRARIRGVAAADVAREVLGRDFERAKHGVAADLVRD